MANPYIGEIRLLAFPRVPTNWVACNGQLLAVPEYEALFTLIGTTYGGNGTTTFGVPNLNGQIPIGQGSGAGLTSRTLGQNGGVETVALTAAQVPAHTHVFQATTAVDTTVTLGPTVVLASDTSQTEKHYLFPTPTPAPTYANFAANMLTSVGGSSAHNNVMPGVGLSYCMCWSGIFPQRPQ